MDWERIETLAGLHCTIKEICSVEKISHEWLSILCERDNGIKLGEFVNDARNKGKSCLRKAQMQAAIDGNIQMQIWLGKNLLGQSDKIEHYAMPEPVIIKRLNGNEVELGSRMIDLEEEEL